MCEMLNMALGPEELQGVIQICDPTSSGFVSMEYFTQLARAHYSNQVEADKLLNQLDARGRSYISYSEFASAINAILKEDNQDKSGLTRTEEKKDNKQRMMGPSVGQRSITRRDDSEVREAESYESFGSMDSNFSPIQCDGVDGSNLNRSTWYRSSLKRNTNHENLPNRRWGSCRHTSGRHVANNPAVSSLNGSPVASSGRSSACDTSDDIYSDISIEEFLDLNKKVQMLEEQMSVFSDKSGDERYMKVKQDNATLQARILMLEEQIRDVELRAQEKLNGVERWHKETVSRMEIEKKLQLENCAIRIQSMEMENCSLREQAKRCQAQSEKIQNQIETIEEKLSMSEATIAMLKEDLEIAREKERKSTQNSLLKQQLADEALQELECLRNEHNKTLQELELKGTGISPATHEQLRSKVTQLREENRRLQEAHEETQALLLTKGIEEGRSLLTGHQSLAAEFEALSQDQPAAVNKELEVKVMLKEQQEVNTQLRRYIDGILLNIVDNYPQLLEVKPALP